VDYYLDTYYKVGDAELANTLTNDKLMASTYTDYDNDVEYNYEISEYDWFVLEKDFAFVGSVLVVRKDGCFFEGFPLPEAGVYFLRIEHEDGVYYTSKLSYPDEVVQLPEVYIPDTIARIDNISWNDLNDKPFGELNRTMNVVYDGNLEGRETAYIGKVLDGASDSYFVKMNDDVFEASGLIGHGVTIAMSDGTIMEAIEITQEFLDENVIDFDDEQTPTDGSMTGSLWMIQPFVVVVRRTSTMIMGDAQFTLSPGLWTLVAINESNILCVSEISYDIKGGIKQLDEKFIPDTVARKSDIDAPKTEFILNSSTEGSTKQFKITIDDTGTLTVAEIVAEEVV
jgi:hypothetical protein